MGLIELMESDSRWQLTITLEADSRNWRARLHKYDDIAAPVYIGVADSMLGAIMELDRNITRHRRLDNGRRSVGQGSGRLAGDIRYPGVRGHGR